MSDGIQSIQDLIRASKTGKVDDESVQGKFTIKQEKIKVNELERLAEQAAAGLGLPYVNLVGFPVSPDALTLINEEDSNLLTMVCFFFDGKNMRLGTMDPENEAVKARVAELEERLHAKAGVYVISSHSLEYVLKLYKSLPKTRVASRGVSITEEELDKYSEQFSTFQGLQAQVDKSPITEILTIILAAAIKSGASDIHIEGEENRIKIRFRVDGILLDIVSLDKELWKRIISRLKVLAKVKINVSDRPQDGRISIFTKNDRIDIRASFLPTNFGESVVMRLLRSSSVGLGFEQLGIRESAFKKLQREVDRPNGMIITTGPTGSGKTTTLYAIVKKLNDSETKIITIEDPVEYQLSGVNQSQVSERYSFAAGLRSIMRQDPDVIMIGEIRDLETAETAIQAALTGHLVLSTIHTNDAAGTVPRFLSMGAKPFLLTPALNAMIGQRLTRRICKKCKVETTIDDAEVMKRVMELLEKLPEEEKKNVDFNNLKFYKGTGCEACQGLGYKGRVGIYEIMTMNEELEKLILAGNVSEYDMKENGLKNGMVTMVQDGVLKALEGQTTIDEVFRVSE